MYYVLVEGVTPDQESLTSLVHRLLCVGGEPGNEASEGGLVWSHPLH